MACQQNLTIMRICKNKFFFAHGKLETIGAVSGHNKTLKLDHALTTKPRYLTLHDTNPITYYVLVV